MNADNQIVNRVEQMETEARTPCATQTPSTSPVTHFLAIASIVRRELWRFDLNKQHRIIGSVLLELSFGMGRESVKIDRLRVFCDLTGLDRSEVSKALDQLRRMRIVNSRLCGELMEYQLEHDSDHWRCQPLLTDKKSMDTLHWVELLNRPETAVGQGIPAQDPELPANWNA
jgi:DNA-binding transcriptional ArsR family regulator